MPSNTVPSNTGSVLDLLSTVAFFAGLPDGELQAIAARLRAVAFAPDDTIVREGETGDSWYLLAEGSAAVVSRDLAGLEITLAVFEPGSHFGEGALVTSGRRSATVKAQGPVSAFVLGRSDFQEVAETCPVFSARLRRHVDLLAVDSFLRKASPFARLPDDTIRLLAAQLRPERITPGGVIVREGEPGDRFYLVRTGNVEVLRGGRRVQLLGPGDCFGEVALLAAVPRTATVRALEDTRLLSLGKPEFDAVVGQSSTLRRQFAEFARIRAGDAIARTIAAADPLTTLMPDLAGHHRRRRYWWLLLAGIGLFALFSVLAVQTGSAVAVFGAVVAGSFVGPVVYVSYLADSQLLPGRPSQLAVTFLLAAALGIPLAAFLEGLVGAGRGALAPSLLVGLVEEPAKALGVVWLLTRPRSRFRMDGLVYGAAAGMGFAAFENLVYGWTASGSVSGVLSTLWVRTILSPFGHGTWTAILCAAIWRAKGAGLPRLDLPVVGAFAFAVVLHGLWNWQPVEGFLLIVWFVVIGVVGLEVLRSVAERASREAVQAVLALNPEATGAGGATPQLICAACGQEAPPGTHYCVRCGAALRAGT